MKKIVSIIFSTISSLLGITLISLACFDPIFLVFPSPYAANLLAIWGFLLLTAPQIIIHRKSAAFKGIIAATIIGLSIIIAAILITLGA